MVSEGTVQAARALSESYSEQRTLREVWHHRPKGRNCSVCFGAFGMCKLY